MHHHRVGGGRPVYIPGSGAGAAGATVLDTFYSVRVINLFKYT